MGGGGGGGNADDTEGGMSIIGGGGGAGSGNGEQIGGESTFGGNGGDGAASGRGGGGGGAGVGAAIAVNGSATSMPTINLTNVSITNSSVTAGSGGNSQGTGGSNGSDGTTGADGLFFYNSTVTITTNGTHEINSIGLDDEINTSEVTFDGDGTLTLSGTTGVRGDINIGQGESLRVILNTDLSDANYVSLDGDATLEVNTTNISGLFPTDNVDLSGVVDFNLSGDVDLDLSDEFFDNYLGSFGKSGTGTMTVIGGTPNGDLITVSEGTLVISNTCTLDSMTSIAMSGGTLDITDAESNEANIGGLTGTGTVTLADEEDSSVLVVAGGGTYTFAGILEGTDGALTIDFESELTLSGVNTYTGPTRIDAGSLIITGNGSLSNESIVTVEGDFYIDEANNSQTIGVIAGQGTIYLGDNGLITDLSSSFEFSGQIDGTASSSLTIQNGGNLTLSGSVVGATSITISGATITKPLNGDLGSGEITMENTMDTVPTLALASGSEVSNTLNIADGDTAAISVNSGTATLSGVVQNAGGGDGGILRKTGFQILALSGANTYNGGTELNEGQITVSNNAALGDASGSLNMADSTTLGFSGNFTVSNNISLSGDATIETGANTPEISGDISGAFVLTKSGSGTLTLSGTNTYSGGTFIGDGQITASTNSALGSGSVTMEDETTLSLDPSLTLSNNIILSDENTGTVSVSSGSSTLSGVISGTESIFIKSGNGTLVLSGTSTYTGITDVSAGTLIVSGSIDSTSTVDIASGATFVLTTTGSKMFNRNIDGAGDFVKQGSGTITLAGNDHAYTGSTTVSDGTLVVTGDIQLSSSISVASGALLKGTGTVPGGIISGSIRPGTSIGNMTVEGSLTIEDDATLIIEISPSDVSTLFVAEDMTIAPNAKLVILPQAGDYEPINHVFLDVGEFANDQRFEESNITIDTSEFEGEVNYSIQYTSTSFVTGQGLIVLSGLLTARSNGLTTQSTAMVDLASDLTTRINRSQIGLIAEVQNQRFLQKEFCCYKQSGCYGKDELATDESNSEEQNACDSEAIYHPYVLFDYSRATIRSREYMLPGADYVRLVLVGCDFNLSDDLTIGIGTGYTNANGSSFEGPNRYGNLDAEGYNISTYLQQRVKGNIFVDGAINWGKNYYLSKRSRNKFSKAKYHGFDFTTQFRLLYQSFYEKLNYRPYVATTYYLQEIRGYTEREQHSNQLRVGLNRFDFLEFEAGLALWAPFRKGCWDFAPQFTVAYIRGFENKPHDVKASFVSSFNGNQFVRIANISNQQWKILAGISAKQGQCNEIFVTYEAVFDSAYSNQQQGRAGVQTSF